MDRVAVDRIITANSLHSIVDSPGGTLASEATGGGSCSPSTLGSGAFGKVETYRYHGAAVAVKELKPGADEETIGGLPSPSLLVVSCNHSIASLRLSCDALAVP